MGIYITKEQDAELYESTLAEGNRLLTISDEIRVTVQKVKTEATEKKESSKMPVASKPLSKLTGYCIRTRAGIPFNIEKPFSAKAYESWAKYRDKEYKEKFCHFSGEPSNRETSFSRPVLRKNWNKVSS